LAAFLLPTGYTVGLLDAVSAVVTIIGTIATLLWLILSHILGLLLWPLMMLFGHEQPDRTRGLPPLQLPQQRPVGAGGTVPGWFEVLRSFIFWIATAGLIVYVTRSYLRDHPELLRGLVSLGPIRALRNFLVAVWQRLAGLVEAVGERIPRRSTRRRARPGDSKTPFRFFRLGALPPRERVLYYYLSILKRAGRQGFPRGRAQTPHEYGATLGPHLPEAQEEMDRLTQDFIEARYSRHPFDRDKERQVRTHWQRVKDALRAMKQAEQDYRRPL